MKQNFTKADLKDGMIVQYHNGEHRFVNGGCEWLGYCDKFFSPHAHSLKHYSNDLINKGGLSDFDIVKVYSGVELLWERKEKKEIKLTTEERAFLNSILLVSDYKYIARDQKCNALYVFRAKPNKGFFSCEWVYSPGDSHATDITDQTKGMFEFITWDDEEPYLIENLLKGEIK